VTGEQDRDADRAGTTSLGSDVTAPIFAKLARANDAFVARTPGDGSARQPVHTVYGGAHLFRAGTAARLGELARASLASYAPDAPSLAAAIGLAPEIADAVHARVVEKLDREAVEDFRIDFEDGYGNRPDAEEDAHAVTAADEVAKGLAARTLPPFLGIRVKAFTGGDHARAARTLDLFATALAQRTSGRLPSGFVVTLPKVQIPEQVTAVTSVLELLEDKLALGRGAIPIELMIEQPTAVFGQAGEVALPALVRAAKGRCRGAHFGTYDYTASCGVASAYQTMDHPACEHAKAVMQVALAGTGVWLSDGATTVLPVGKDPAVVHDAWKLHASNVRHSLITGFYQGWDLHPAQLVARYAAVYAFFLEGLGPATARLRRFVDEAAQATRAGQIFDDAATGQGLLVFFLRGLSCGALREDDVRATGLTVDELASRSFARIVTARRP
jgi:citrate lyase beta subunit